MDVTLLAESSFFANVSLIFFIGLFVAIVLYLFVFRRDGWDRDARIPLDEEHKK
jgi:cbb3-type cytochrome oxidase subunit 3